MRSRNRNARRQYMKRQLVAADIELLQACLHTEVGREDIRQAIRDILAEVGDGQVFSSDTGNRLADHCRDLGLSVEQLDLLLARQLMALALSIRSSGPVLQKKSREYERLLEISRSGVVTINGIELAFGQNPSVPLLKALANGRYEQQEAGLLMQFIGPEDRVLELGAGIGYMGILAMSRCKPAHYVAYEANPALMPLIERNMVANGVKFEVRNALLSSHEEGRDFYITRGFWASSLIRPQSGSCEKVTVPSQDKNSVMAELRPTALVVDIEGGEAELFTGLDLASVEKIIIEIHPAVLDDERLTLLYGNLIRNGFLMNFAASGKLVQYWYR